MGGCAPTAIGLSAIAARRASCLRHSVHRVMWAATRESSAFVRHWHEAQSRAPRTKRMCRPLSNPERLSSLTGAARMPSGEVCADGSR